MGDYVRMCMSRSGMSICTHCLHSQHAQKLMHTCTEDGGRGLALSPGPAQNLGKGPGHTCKNFCMCCVSSLRLKWRNHIRPLPITTFLTHEGSRLVPRPLKNWNEANRLFVNLEFQKFIAYLCLLGYYSCLTGFPCACSVARSAHLLCNAIVNGSWLPHDHKRHVIVT